jgi:hypothetical protein
MAAMSGEDSSMTTPTVNTSVGVESSTAGEQDSVSVERMESENSAQEQPEAESGGSQEQAGELEGVPTSAIAAPSSEKKRRGRPPKNKVLEQGEVDLTSTDTPVSYTSGGIRVQPRRTLKGM